MKTDRELLEMAAKAAGLEFKWREGDPKWAPEHVGPAAWINGCWQAWNPLTDDGDALRLAVRCGIQAGYSDFSGDGFASWNRGANFVKHWGPDDLCASTRRAIVTAAAKLGEAMP